MTRADRRTLVRRLTDQGLSQRQIAARLGVSKDTVRRDLRLGLRHPAHESAAGQRPDAPHDAPDGAPSGEPGAPQPETPADEAMDVAPPAPVLRIDLARRPRLLMNLNAMMLAGLKAPAVIDDAVHAVAVAYQRAIAWGELKPGQPFQVEARVRPQRRAT